MFLKAKERQAELALDDEQRALIAIKEQVLPCWLRLIVNLSPFQVEAAREVRKGLLESVEEAQPQEFKRSDESEKIQLQVFACFQLELNIYFRDGARIC